MGWQVSYNGTTWRDDSLRMIDVERVLELTQESWVGFELQPFGSPRQLAAIIAMFLARDDESVDAKAKIEELMLLKRKELMDCIGKTEDDTPTEWRGSAPLVEGDLSTDGSSGVPTTTDGLPASPEPKASVTSDS